jgi:hypothetical protein
MRRANSHDASLSRWMLRAAASAADLNALLVGELSRLVLGEDTDPDHLKSAVRILAASVFVVVARGRLTVAFGRRWCRPIAGVDAAIS